MKYIRTFDTTTEYTAAESSLVTPNVSLTKDNMSVHYKPYVPTPTVPEFTLDFEFPITVMELKDKRMTVTNGVPIVESEVVEHLKFKTSDNQTVTVEYGLDGLELKIEPDKFNELTLGSNYITFGFAEGGPTLISYSWV